SYPLLANAAANAASSRTRDDEPGGSSDCPSGYRFRRQRYAAKLIAVALFTSVCSPEGRRRSPRISVVATATSSYAAHASYIHVCAIARARATIGGPLRSALLRRTSSRAVALQSVTTVAQAEVAHTSAATKVVAHTSIRGRRPFLT